MEQQAAVERHRQSRRPDGSVLHVWQPEAHPRGRVLLQHGLFEYAERYVVEYSQLVPELTSRGFEVWALDLLGHGASSGDRGVVDLVAALESHLSVRREAVADGLPLLLLGHSLGGLLTAASVAAKQSGIIGAVVMSPALAGPTSARVRRGLRAAAHRWPGAPAPTRKAPRSGLTSRADVLERSAIDPMMGERGISLMVGSSVLDISDVVWRAADDWRVPTLVVHGELDRWTNPRWSRELVERINRDDVVRVEVAGGLHELLHDTDATSTLELVLGWVEGRFGGRSPRA